MLTPLLTMLGSSANAYEIREYLDQEIRGHFGMSPERVGTAAMAERLIAWRQSAHGEI